MKLSPNFTLAEMTFSQTADRLGISNTPPPKVIDNLRRLADALEEVRLWLGKPVMITSGYRCAELNRKIPGSSPSSAHVHGLAADIVVKAMSPRQVAQRIAAMDHEFDQIILEHSWVHLGLAESSPRKQLLTLTPGGGYAKGLS